MKHIYHIQGMTCGGCRSHVEELLSGIDGVTQARVDLDRTEAILEMERHIPLDTLQKVFQDDGGRYSIHLPEQGEIRKEKKHDLEKIGTGTGEYYCPMQCEGDKTYDKPGSCPVCGMALVALVTDLSAEEKTYKVLLGKFWLALGFTLPIFLIAMSEMIPANPLFEWMPQRSWNWVHF
ncbi:MAG: heavy metal translocating P-type ATPase, partial [Flavobacteriaceae bacterium]|nr:heavy metal translocating P-type ATPase [Flavobacteriaceae bacterium]